MATQKKTKPKGLASSLITKTLAVGATILLGPMVRCIVYGAKAMKALESDKTRNRHDAQNYLGIAAFSLGCAIVNVVLPITSFITEPIGWAATIYVEQKSYLAKARGEDEEIKRGWGERMLRLLLPKTKEKHVEQELSRQKNDKIKNDKIKIDR